MLPDTVTLVALAAVTVKVEEPPSVMDSGLAAMVTVGLRAATTFRLKLAWDEPPHLSNSSTIICCVPSARLTAVLSFSASTVYVSLLPTYISILEIPFEHVDAVAAATTLTGDVTVEPPAGLLTVTVANAGVAAASRVNRA